MKDDLWTLDATGMAALVERGDLSPLELVDAAIARVEALDPELGSSQGVSAEIRSDLSREQYLAMVEHARARMHVGDIFEVVLSRKFSADYAGPPSAIYELMRRINPSPYEFFLQLGAEQRGPQLGQLL